jgi:argininosuccinate synthase
MCVLTYRGVSAIRGELTVDLHTGHVDFVKADLESILYSPDDASIELLQKGDAKRPQEPWASMENTGVW